MKKTLARGLMNLLPMALSLWLFWSLFVSLDGLGIFILELVGINQHFVGAGFILVVAIVFAVGLLFSVSPIVWLYGWIERQLMRFPLFKSVYGSIRDIASLMNREGQLSYQMAGVTSLVKREDLILVDWSFEEAMRFNLTAGISQTPGAATVKTKAE